MRPARWTPKERALRSLDDAPTQRQKKGQLGDLWPMVPGALQALR